MSLAVQTPAENNRTSPGAQPQAIKVMIVDDSAVVRGLVSRWIGEEDGMEIIARHSNGQRAVQDVAKSKPDIIILDVEMPVMDGLSALPELLKGKPGVKIIMASTLTQRNAEISLKALSLGATDYIPKPDSNSGITTSASFRRDLVARIRSLGAPRRTPLARTGATGEGDTSSCGIPETAGCRYGITTRIETFFQQCAARLAGRQFDRWSAGARQAV